MDDVHSTVSILKQDASEDDGQRELEEGERQGGEIEVGTVRIRCPPLQ